MKRILLVCLLLALMVAVCDACEKCPCPDNTTLLAKYECGCSKWVFVEGEDIVTLTGDCRGATWTTSSEEVKAASAKGGQECYMYPGGTTGTISADDLGGHDISNVKFCKSKPDPSAVTLTHCEQVQTYSWWRRLLARLFPLKRA